MSLKEFATVTRLNCGKIPDRPKKKKRNPLNEKLYWNELLGTLNLSAYQTLATSLIAKEKIALSQASVAIRESEGGTPDEDPISEEDNLARLKTNHGRLSSMSYMGMLRSSITSAKFVLGLDSNLSSYKNVNAMVAVKSILDDPYEEWSAGADFYWFDEIEDDAVDNIEGFAFRKEMFIGSLTANDLAPMRLEKKHKEKEPKEKNNKYNTADMSDGEGSDPQSHIGITNFVTSQFSDKFRSTTRDIRDEISSLESRLDHAMDAKIEKLVESTNHAQHIALLQATVFGSLQEIERKLTNALVDNVKILQSAVIKGKGLFTHNHIDGILRDLNEMSQVSPQVNLDGAEVHQELQGPNVVANPLSMSETAPDAPDELPNANPINYVLPTKHAEHYVSETHKSKRLSIMPSGLNDFRCDPKIVVGLSHSRSRSSFSSVGRTPPRRIGDSDFVLDLSTDESLSVSHGFSLGASPRRLHPPPFRLLSATINQLATLSVALLHDESLGDFRNRLVLKEKLTGS
ncbi:hypothetical protein DY000_02060470 [Brassica cretica]|uniref:Uncharacterized protein n=1 Tax=Brassica cretica TaxID=69181 RepID=A0ABQ7B3D7_BRACR|nr:hypothetical protein DY000_02060470 [Brassica cretica]